VEGNLTFRSFLLLLFNLTLGSFGQLFLKMGLPDDLSGHSRSVLTTLVAILHAMTNSWVLLGLGLYSLSVITWLLLLSKVRLSVAYPMISISYFFVVALAAVSPLHEHVRWSYAAGGLLLISAGVTFIGVGLGHAGAKKQ
jgi:drug/metabolite transporter (DMT)-like permease